MGSEKRFRQATSKVRQFAQNNVKRKKQKLKEKSSLETSDLLSPIISSGHSDENFVTDMELLKEIHEKADGSSYNEVKDMVYAHDSLCESMRLYPPVPSDTKEAACDDVLPDGTVVKKGTKVTCHPYVMGRMEKLWGEDWEEFRRERWLGRDTMSSKWSFVSKDSYIFLVFQARPRVYLGKEMAFLQIKIVVLGLRLKAGESRSNDRVPVEVVRTSHEVIRTKNALFVCF
ncbi:hypothetical protein GIB67_028111 [Kingdonia uniflora]|uniref:Uncharacterized protein n=1 Tax=Kingdonia uniflora TaxID=39325 RepID=A0A7J7NR84_9MAGN|nr:hypothetical protein GIB67_028111 [Kingdonia uniflora]